MSWKKSKKLEELQTSSCVFNWFSCIFIGVSHFGVKLNPLPTVDTDIAHMFLRFSGQRAGVAKGLDLSEEDGASAPLRLIVHPVPTTCTFIEVTKHFLFLLCWFHCDLMSFSAKGKKRTSTALWQMFLSVFQQARARIRLGWLDFSLGQNRLLESTIEGPYNFWREKLKPNFQLENFDCQEQWNSFPHNKRLLECFEHCLASIWASLCVPQLSFSSFCLLCRFSPWPAIQKGNSFLSHGKFNTVAYFTTRNFVHRTRNKATEWQNGSIFKTYGHIREDKAIWWSHHHSHWNNTESFNSFHFSKNQDL